MNSRILSRLFLGFAVLCVAVSAFAQGLCTEGTTSGGPLGDKVRNTKTYIMPKMYRHEGGDGNVVIIRLDKEMLYLVTPEAKTYSVMTFAEMEEKAKTAGAQMDARTQEMQEKLKDMSDEERQMMEKMMGRMMGGKEKKVDVEGPGEKKTINGYSCAKYTATSDGNVVLTVWTSKDVKGFESMKHDWEKFSSRLMSMNPLKGKILAEAFKKIDGFPMQTEVGGMTMLVTKIEKRTTPASQFEVPSSYTQTDSPLKNME